MHRAAFRVTLRIGGHERILIAASEREIALQAESVLRRHDDPPGGVAFIVDAADSQACVRIAAYLADVSREMEVA